MWSITYSNPLKSSFTLLSVTFVNDAIVVPYFKLPFSYVRKFEFANLSVIVTLLFIPVFDVIFNV